MCFSPWINHQKASLTTTSPLNLSMLSMWAKLKNIILKSNLSSVFSHRRALFSSNPPTLPITASKYVKRFHTGLRYNSQDIPVIISGGLGTSRRNILFCAPTDIVVVTLRHITDTHDYSYHYEPWIQYTIWTRLSSLFHSCYSTELTYIKCDTLIFLYFLPKSNAKAVWSLMISLEECIACLNHWLSKDKKKVWISFSYCQEYPNLQETEFRAKGRRSQCWIFYWSQVSFALSQPDQ